MTSLEDRLTGILRARSVTTRPKSRGTIKSRPEDFRVMEVTNGWVTQPSFVTKVEAPSGPRTRFTLTKRGIPGEAAYREIVRQLGIARSAVTDHGLKDSRAVTAQTIVVEGGYTPIFAHDKIWLHQEGRAAAQLRRGGHEANRFEIFVATSNTEARVNHQPFRNLFGYQRFGGTHGREIGRLLLEGDFEAAGHIASQDRRAWKLRKLVRETGSWGEAILHEEVAFECGFFVMQWVSHLWNQVAKETDQKFLPTWSCDEAWRYTHLWSPDDVDATMYDMVHQFVRPVWVKADNQQAVAEEGGVRHSFSLRPGSYATTFLATLYDLEDATDVNARGFRG